ncbi:MULTISPECIES: U32 family peptidase [unclassified Methanobrevibacter]|jgi:putative protease|uniref:U32 family peptidase n=1 Tax=unclassified Methanobrevibacter TaxID=2638681 RepID=UPI0039B8966C
MVELLAPAGNFTSLSAALKNGADSIYIGLEGVNMRVNANNFTIKDIKKVAEIVKEYNSKLYVCTNIIMKDKDINLMKKQLPIIKEAGADGVILSDLGLIHSVVENDLEAHLSVQENTTNLETLKILNELGVKRAILSRELNLNEISQLAHKSPIETEIFIHGAMCMAISGRCFLSYGLYNRSANCGDCLQPCRKEWKLTYEGNNNLNVKNTTECEDESFIITQAYDNSYHTNFFSPKDMALIEHIPEIMKTGVDSFKIEGRARSPDYVATATKVYREAIDSYNSGSYEYKPLWVEELNKVFNRGFDTGFYFKIPYTQSQDNQSKYIKKDIGKVVNYYNKIHVVELKIWDDLHLGDEIMIQGPTTGSITHKISSMQINKKPIQTAYKGQNVAILIPEKLRESDYVYKLIKRE